MVSSDPSDEEILKVLGFSRWRKVDMTIAARVFLSALGEDSVETKTIGDKVVVIAGRVVAIGDKSGENVRVYQVE